MVYFHVLNIYGLAEICEYNLQIKYMDTPPAFHLHFCGFYSKLKVYPPNPKFEYVTTFGVTTYESFSIVVVFDILSANINETASFNSVSNIRIHFVFINIIKEIVMNFYIIVSKLSQVEFHSIKEDKLFDHVVFDGPGFLSPRISLNFPFRCSTFQYILQVRTEKSQKPLVNFIGKYYKRNWHFENIHYKKKYNNIQMYYGTRGVDINISVFHVDEGYNFNVTFSYWFYLGQEHPNCLFGGLMFFEGNFTISD